MIVIKHNLTGERFMYNEQPVNHFPSHLEQPANYTLPKNFSLDSNQTPVPFLISKNGQTVTRWEAESQDPIKLQEKW